MSDTDRCSVGSYGGCLRHQRPFAYCLDAIRSELDDWRNVALQHEQAVADLRAVLRDLTDPDTNGASWGGLQVLQAVATIASEALARPDCGGPREVPAKDYHVWATPPGEEE